MNELSRHIEILLLDNDCVIVPGFGGFMAHHRPAEYVAEEGMFYPPQRTLGFNPQLKLNDSLLVQSYVEAYDISYPEAVRRIDEEVEEVKQKIAFEGQYEFHGIGTIKQQADERYDFEPCAAGLLTPTLYALNSFALDSLPKEQSPAITVPLTPLVHEETKTHISIQTLRTFATAAMILLLFVFTSIPAGRGSSNVTMCSVIDTEFISSIIQGNTVPSFALHTATEAVDSVADTKEVAETDSVVEEKTMAEEPAAGRFAIVLASKVSKTGAEDYISSLRKAGYNEASIYERGTMRKVVYGNYSSEGEAQESLRKLRDSDEKFAEAWVTMI